MQDKTYCTSCKAYTMYPGSDCCPECDNGYEKENKNQHYTREWNRYNELPAELQNNGVWKKTPVIPAGYKVWEFIPSEVEVVDLGVPEGPEMFCIHGRLYCGAENLEMAEQIFEKQIKMLAVKAAKIVPAKQKKKIIQMPGQPIGVIHGGGTILTQVTSLNGPCHCGSGRLFKRCCGLIKN